MDVGEDRQKAGLREVSLASRLERSQQLHFPTPVFWYFASFPYVRLVRFLSDTNGIISLLSLYPFVCRVDHNTGNAPCREQCKQTTSGQRNLTITSLDCQALDLPSQRGDVLHQLFTDIALEVDSRAKGKAPLLDSFSLSSVKFGIFLFPGMVRSFSMREDSVLLLKNPFIRE